MLLVVVAVPVEMLKVQIERVQRSRQLVQDLDAGVDDFGADAIRGDGGDFI